MDFTSTFDPSPFTCSQFSEREVLVLKAQFDNLDESNSGLLTPRDIEKLLEYWNVRVSRSTIYNVVQQYDENQVGGIAFGQFLELLKYRSVENQTHNQIQKMFRKYDRSNKGYIDQKDVQRVALQLGHSIGGFNLKNLGGQSGKLTLEEFHSLMTREEQPLFDY